jgi:hypothetical protein
LLAAAEASLTAAAKLNWLDKEHAFLEKQAAKLFT